MSTTFEILAFPLLLGGALASCGGGSDAGPESPWDARCPAPRIAPWRAPPSSALDAHLAALERAFPDPALPGVDPELVEDLDATIDLWTPGDPDRWNRMRESDLASWGAQLVARVERRLHDDGLDVEARGALLDKLLALGNEGTVPVLERLLVDEIPVDLRARAAYALGTHGGDEVLDTLIFEFRVMYQVDRYYPDDIYERDEYVALRLGEALARRSNLTALPYLVDLDRRTATREVNSVFSAEVLEPIVRSTWVEVLRAHLPEHPELQSTEDTPPRERLVAATEELHAFWRVHGYAPRERDAVPAPTELESPLGKRLLRRLLPFRDRPLRPVDEGRHVLSSLGTRPLHVLRVGLEDPSLFVREYTLDAVERLGPPAAPLAADVERLLGDDDTRTRALEALGSLGTPADVSAWCGLTLVPDPELRLLATLALGRLRAREALPCLLRARERYAPAEHPETSLALAYALVRLEDPTGLALWAALREHANALDPIRLEELAAATWTELVARGRVPDESFALATFWQRLPRSDDAR